MFFHKFTSGYDATHDDIAGATCYLAGFFPGIFHIDRNVQRFQLALCNTDKGLRQQCDSFFSGCQFRDDFTMFGLEIDGYFAFQIIVGKNIVKNIFRFRTLTGNSN